MTFLQYNDCRNGVPNLCFMGLKPSLITKGLRFNFTNKLTSTCYFKKFY